MKTIKIKYVGFWDGFDENNNLIIQILKKHFIVKICEDADYVVCNLWGKEYDYCNYPQVRIMFEGENVVPDFTLVDYAISPYPIDFLDRNFYLPCGVEAYFRNHTFMDALEKKDRNYPDDFLKNKKIFATFISAHESENNIRGDFFKQLCKYKEVDSIGTYLNNRPNVKTAWFNSSKTDYQKLGKFALCFESTKNEGFVTEKIVDAFYSDCIPIYYGSDTVKNIFNKKAFINVADYDSFDDAIRVIAEIDNDDNKYIEMLREPIFVKQNYPSELRKRLEEFIINIFSQPIEQAYRRPRTLWGKRYNDYLQGAIDLKATNSSELIKMIIKRFFNRFL